jgi:hypothetical protein
MPNRIIHAKATMSATLDKLSDGAERFFWRLTTVADDVGRFDADPRVLLAATFPRRVGLLRPNVVAAWREELRRAGLIQCYAVGDRRYGAFVRWREYQRPRHSRAKFPDPPNPDSEGQNPESAADGGDSPQLAADGGELPQVAADGGELRPVLGTRYSVLDTRYSLVGATDPPAASRRQVAAKSSRGSGEPRSAPSPNGWHKLPDSIAAALGRAPRLGAEPTLRRPAWWQAEVRANPGVNYAAEVLKAEAWIIANPTKAPRRNLSRFLHAWLGRAERPE